jgi:hypothetical protein
VIPQSPATEPEHLLLPASVSLCVHMCAHLSTFEPADRFWWLLICTLYHFLISYRHTNMFILKITLFPQNLIKKYFTSSQAFQNRRQSFRLINFGHWKQNLSTSTHPTRTVFCNTKLCSLVDCYQHFGKTCFLLFLYPNYGGSRFLQNVGLYQSTQHHIPEDSNLH